MTQFTNYIARLIRYHRKKARLTQQKLAFFAGIGKTAVFDIEKGKATVRLATLLAVLHVLNLRIEFRGPLMEKFQREDEAG